MRDFPISIVIAACNEGENLVDMVRCIVEDGSHPHFEVIVVDDGSTDGSGSRLGGIFGGKSRVSVVRTEGLGVARARNFGSRLARGDILVFMDGHCYTPPGWLETLTAPLSDLSVGVVGPAFASLHSDDGALGLGVTWDDARLEMRWLPKQDETPYAVPLLPGGCDAMRRADFEKIGGYDHGMSRWGSEGQELSLRAWLMGYQVVVHPRVVIHHLFRKNHPYGLDAAEVLYNRLRMALLHMREDRVRRVMDHYKADPAFSRSVMSLLASDVMERRKQWAEQRRHDDDWFFTRFHCRF